MNDKQGELEPLWYCDAVLSQQRVDSVAFDDTSEYLNIIDEIDFSPNHKSHLQTNYVQLIEQGARQLIQVLLQEQRWPTTVL